MAKYNPKKIIIFSRDEMKQWNMSKEYSADDRVRFFIGDVRDKDRLYRALDGVDYVVHAAATKIVPTAEYNPFECVKTNVNGAMNLIDASIDKGVKVLSPFQRIKLVVPSIFMELPNLLLINCLLLLMHILGSTEQNSLLCGMEMSWAPAARLFHFFPLLKNREFCPLQMSV
jgi:hypothetical protein